MVHDNGTEFIGWKFQILLDTYGIGTKYTTMKNTTDNYILEKVHLNMVDMLRRANFISLQLQEEITTLP